MLIIGVTGSHEDVQRAVTLQLHSLFDCVGVAFRMPDVSEQQRIELLNTMFKPGKIQKQRLVLSNLIYPSEVTWLMQKGGYLCHAIGRPSDTIAQTPSHYLITPAAEPERHYQPVAEVYSLILLHYKNKNRHRR